MNSPVPLSPDLYILPRLPPSEARGAFSSHSPRESLWLSENQVQDWWQTENQEGGRGKESGGCGSGAAQAGKMMAQGTMKLDAVYDDFASQGLC